MGSFKIKAKNRLEDMKVGDTISESDFATLTPSGEFVQLEYIEDENQKEPYKVKPGIWAIKSENRILKLSPTSFINDKILSSFVHTSNITDKIDCFFKNLHVYKELGFEVPKRAALLYGPAGTGKTVSISVVANKYAADNKTAVILWHTDKFESHVIKDFIKSFEYEGVEKLILIVEDIGGVEIEEKRMGSDSSLLSLLDNQEKIFTIPIFILATTNYPAGFMGNLTNRPNRFDDKIEVGYPKKEQRKELLAFFLKEKPSKIAEDLIVSYKADEFSAAHIREVVIRSKIYDKTVEKVIEEMYNEIELYKKGFENKESRMGF